MVRGHRGKGKKSFHSIGVEPPDLIQEALNLKDINFQQQFDPQFLVFSMPTQITSTINKIANLDDIDLLQSAVKTKVKENKDRVKYLKAAIEEREGIIQALPDLDTVTAKLERLKRLSDRRGKLDLTKNALTATINAIIEIKKNKKVLPDIKGIEIKLDEIRRERKNVKEIKSAILQLDSFVDAYKRNVQSLEVYEDSKLLHLKNIRKIKNCPLCLSDINSKQIRRIEEAL